MDSSFGRRPRPRVRSLPITASGGVRDNAERAPFRAPRGQEIGSACRRSRGFAGPFAAIHLRHRFERHGPDPRAHPGTAERLEAVLAELPRRRDRRLQEGARIEARPIADEGAPDGACHRQPDVGVDVDLAYAVPDAATDFLDRPAEGLLHLAAVLADYREPLLRHR